MKKITCDGCNCELSEETSFGVVVGGTVQEQFDLCGNCRDALIDWLANRQENHTPCETKEENRAHEEPKNDKIGYSVDRLEKELHKGRVAIKTAFSVMGIEPAKWIKGKTTVIRYYLGGSEMAELKQRLGVN